MYILSEWKETVPLSEDQKLIKELRALIKEKDKEIELLKKSLCDFLAVNEYFKGYLAGMSNNYSPKLKEKDTDIIDRLFDVRKSFDLSKILDLSNKKDKK